MIFIIIFILSFLLQLFLPWWIILFIAFTTCALFCKNGMTAFWQPFFAICLLWICYSIYKSVPNDHILANRVAVMMGINNWWVLLLLTGFISGLVVGISGYCGYYFKKYITN